MSRSSSRIPAPGDTRDTIRRDGLALDTGFLVHNVRNYPLLTRLFDELGVATQPSEMSFSVACPCGLEYSGRRPFAQARRAIDPRFHGLLGEIGRWLLTAKRSLADVDESWSLGRYLDERRFSQRFRRHFLVPLTAALWSTAPGRALEYPAATAIRFFDNHGMLGFGRSQWRYVTGGSDSYVRAIAERLGPKLQLGNGVRSLRRTADGIEVRTADDDDVTRSTRVVVATHADQALGCSRIRPRANGASSARSSTRGTRSMLHTDSAQLPKARPPARRGTIASATTAGRR